MKWYVPSWNGDLRFEEAGKDRTTLTIIAPTKAELDKLAVMELRFKKEKWIEGPLWDPQGANDVQVRVIQTGVLDVAKTVLKEYRPGRATLTAVLFESGKVEAIEAGGSFWKRVSKAMGGKGRRSVAEQVLDPKTGDPYREPAEEKKDKPKTAATVKRATPCCPECFVAPIEPAREVLFEYLTQDEQDQWDREHTIEVVGGFTGIRYLLAHRHSRTAERQGKICRDLDNDEILHFHDNTVPPEEEVLGAMLVLRHREDWLRCADTLVESEPIFDNSFSNDGMDGTRSTQLFENLGEAVLMLSPSYRAWKEKRSKRRRTNFSPYFWKAKNP